MAIYSKTHDPLFLCEHLDLYRATFKRVVEGCGARVGGIVPTERSRFFVYSLIGNRGVSLLSHAVDARMGKRCMAASDMCRRRIVEDRILIAELPRRLRTLTPKCEQFGDISTEGVSVEDSESEPDGVRLRSLSPTQTRTEQPWNPRSGLYSTIVMILTSRSKIY